jgi:hypothetical protein
MKYNRKINNGYLLTNVIFIVAFITFIFTVAIFFISFYLHIAASNVKYVKDFKEYYEVMDEILSENFSDVVSDGITSPFEGWFLKLPPEKNGFTIKYDVIDSKFDVNHIDIEGLGKNKYFVDKKKVKDYLYYPKDLKKYLSKEYVKKYDEIFSIYCIPNLNVVKPEKLKMFMDSQMIDEEVSKGIVDKLKVFRGANKYLEVPKIIINEQNYEVLRTYFPRDRMDRFYVLFDYKATVNLNFVSKEVLEMGIKLCNSKKSLDTSNYWNILNSKRESGSTIRNINEVFVTDAKTYEKFFGVDSFLFKISITNENNKKNRMMLSSIVRRYKEFNGRNNYCIMKTEMIDLKAKELKDKIDASSDMKDVSSDLSNDKGMM